MEKFDQTINEIFGLFKGKQTPQAPQKQASPQAPQQQAPQQQAPQQLVKNLISSVSGWDDHRLEAGTRKWLLDTLTLLQNNLK
jgi:hypothetical protein